MSKLQELIAELCPNGVEFKKLGVVCSVLRGKRLTKDKLSAENAYPVFHGGIEPLGYYTEYNRSENTVMIINVGASAGTVGFCDKKFWSSDGCFCLSNNPELNSKFLFYYLSSHESNFISKVRYAGIPTLDAKVITDFEIPIPPLAVQEEIVKILDRFAEYTAELQARKEQYEYYRNLLLTFNPSASGYGTNDEQKIKDITVWGGHNYEVSWKTLGEVCDILDSQRKPVAKGKRISGQYPYYGANGIQDYVSEFLFDGDFLLVGEDGSVINPDNSPILNWASGQIWVNNHAHILAEKADIAMLRYLYYALQVTDVSDIVRGTPPKLNQANLRNIKLPIPPLEVQERIVAILDRFETLVNDLTQGLPAEIEARKQQYEYYRNQLLTFKRIA